MSTFAVKTENLTKNFGMHPVLSNLSFQIEKGSAFGLVGLNGAGKTTLIRLLLGILKASDGGISVLDADPWEHKEQMYRRIGVVLESDGFWGNLSVRENLKIFAAAKRIAWSEVETYISEYWAKTAIFANDKKVKFLSRGQKMQCALCRAFLGWPEMFFFDEPVIALDVEAYEHFCRMVKAARSRSATFLISSHQLEAIDDICDTVGILRDRQVTALLTPHQIDNPFWTIEAAADSRVAEVLNSTGGDNISYVNGCWRFSISEPEKKVPLIIKHLVEFQIDIMRAQPEQSGFSDEIRKLYCGAERS